MSQHTGRDYINAVFQGKKLDRVTSRVMHGLLPGLQMAGVTGKECRTVPAKFVEVVAKMNEYLPSDAVLILIGDEALAAEMPGKAAGLTREEVVARHRSGVALLKDKADFKKWSLPDLKKGGRLPYYMEICKIADSVIKRTTIDGWGPSPWSGAMGWRGPEQFIYDTVDDPEFVHSLLRYSTDYCKMVGDAIIESGVGMYTVGEPSGGCSVISPKMFRQWAKPYMQELLNHLKKKGIPIAMHMCGYMDPIAADLVEMGYDELSIDSPSSLQNLIEIAKDRVVIMGNAPTNLFTEGTKEEIEAKVKECLKIGGRSRYVICSGCAVPDVTPLENIKHFLDCAHQYGHYNYVKAAA